MGQPSWIGQTLSGRYRIEAMLGQGGMSAVYKAADPNLKRVVAIKLIHPHLSGDASFVVRFEEEAAAVAKLRHSNIVQVYDFNIDNGVYYMVLEYIPGETLHERLHRLHEAGQFLSIEQCIRFTADVLDALNYAHERGIIHRDVKPPNIMLDVLGHAILMDFGIVKILGETSHTATGAVVGTARYMAPEVIRGEVADGRSDIYSMGVTLYEMLGGRPPFVADSAVTLMMMHLNDPVPNVRNFRPEIPDSLISILDKALQKDRDLRYRTAAEMADDLRRALTAPAVVPPPVPTMLTPEDQRPEASKVTITRQASEVALAAQAVRAQEPPAAPQQEEPAAWKVSTTPSMPMMSPVIAEVPPPPMTAAAPPSRRMTWWIAGIALIGALICCVAGGGYLLSMRAAAQAGPPSAALTAAALPSETATMAPATEIAVAPVVTLEPSSTPTEAVTTTPTYPPLYARIDSITIDANNRYVVVYETFGYTEALPGKHVHFFFNTVPPEQAGAPGVGPWILYGGPRPFTGYRLSDRPAGASQMCSLVANPDHSVVANSGNCLDLPLPP
jgi:serine/threonine protein kinase